MDCLWGGEKRIKGRSKSFGMNNWRNKMGKILSTTYAVERVGISGVLGAHLIHAKLSKNLIGLSSGENWRRKNCNSKYS